MTVHIQIEEHLKSLEKLLRKADDEWLFALPGDKRAARKRRTAINAACNALHKGTKA